MCILFLYCVTFCQAGESQFRELFGKATSIVESDDKIVVNNIKWPRYIVVYFDDFQKDEFCRFQAVVIPGGNFYYVADRFLTIGNMKCLLQNLQESKWNKKFASKFWGYYRELLSVYVPDGLVFSNYINDDKKPFMPMGQSNVVLFESIAYRVTGMPFTVLDKKQFLECLAYFNREKYTFRSSPIMGDLESSIKTFGNTDVSELPFCSGSELILKNTLAKTPFYSGIRTLKGEFVKANNTDALSGYPFYDYVGSAALILPVLNIAPQSEVLFDFENNHKIPHRVKGVFEDDLPMKKRRKETGIENLSRIGKGDILN